MTSLSFSGDVPVRTDVPAVTTVMAWWYLNTLLTGVIPKEGKMTVKMADVVTLLRDLAQRTQEFQVRL